MPPLTYAPKDQNELSSTIAEEWDVEQYAEDRLTEPVTFGDEEPAPLTEADALLREEEFPALADAPVLPAPQYEDGTLGVWGDLAEEEPPEENPAEQPRDDASSGYPLPKPEDANQLPYGDYAPEDVRVQYLRQIGQYDGNFYTHVFNQHASRTGANGQLKDPTLEEVSSAAEKAAKALYTQLTGLEPRNHNKVEVERLANEFRRMYDEQRAIMQERGDLRSWSAPTDDPEAVGQRTASALTAIGAGGPDTYDTYLRQMTRRGKIDSDMSPEQVDAVVVDAILKDLDATDLSKQDKIRFRKQLDNGDWGALRPAGVTPTVEEPTDNLRKKDEPSAVARMWDYLWGGDEDTDPMTEAPAQPVAPTGGDVPVVPAADAAPADSALPELGAPTGADMTPLSTEEAAVGAAVEGEQREATWRDDLAAGVLQLQQVPPGIATAFAAQQRRSADQLMELQGLTPDVAARINELQESITSDRLELQAAKTREQTTPLLTRALKNQDELDQLTSTYGVDGQTYANASERATTMYEKSASALTSSLPKLLRLQGEIEALPEEEVVRRFNKAEGFDEVAAVIGEDPLTLIRSFSLRSGPVTGATILASIIGGTVAGPTGAAAAGGAVGGGAELGLTVAQEVIEDLRKQKVDVDDPMALASYIENNPDTFQAALRKGYTRAAVIGAADAISGGAVGRVTQALRGSGTSAARNVAVTAGSAAVVEPTTEAGGEALAGLATDDFSWNETLAEALGSVGPGAVQGAGQAAGDILRTPRTATPPEDGAPPEDGTEALLQRVADLRTEREDALAVAEQEGTPEEAQAAAGEVAETQDVADDVELAVAAEADAVAADAVDALLAPTARGPSETTAQSLTDDAAPTRPTTEDVLATVVPGAAPIERVAQQAALDTTIDRDVLTGIEEQEVSARTGVPVSAEAVEAAVITGRSLAVLQSEVSEGQRNLSDNDRRALAGLEIITQDVVRNANTALATARDALATARGEALEVAARAPTAPWKRSRTAKGRMAQEQKAAAADALASLRNAGSVTPPNSASVIGVLAGMPRGAVAMARGMKVEAGSALEPFGAAGIRTALSLPPTSAPVQEQVTALASAAAAMANYQQALRAVTMANVMVTDSEGATVVDPNLERRMTQQTRVPEAEPMRQYIAARAFSGRADAVQLASMFDTIALARASDKDLRRWSTAKTLRDVQGMLRPNSSRAGVQFGGNAQELAQIRQVASAILDARQASAKAGRAVEALNYAASAINAVSKVHNDAINMTELFRTMEKLRGESEGVALREALRRHAPSLLEDEGRPIQALGQQLTAAYSALPAAARTSDEALAAAYASEMTAAQLYGENWRARRVIRQVHQVALDATVEEILSLDETATQERIDRVNEELGVLAAAEQIYARERAAQATPPVVSGDIMTDEQIGEMLLNEFALDEDTAADVVDRAKDVANAALGDAEARRALRSQATEFSVRFNRPLIAVEVADDGSNNRLFDADTENPDIDAETSATVRWLSEGARGNEVVQLLPEWTAPATDMVRKMYRHLGIRKPTIVLPVYALRDDASLQMQLRNAAGDSWFGQALPNILARLEETAGEANGWIYDYPGGAVILIDETMSSGAMAATALHETGHAVTADLLSRASQKTVDLLFQAYRNSPWAVTIADVEDTRAFWPAHIRPGTDGETIIPEDVQRYANSFHEWFASQVGLFFAEGRHLKPTQPKGLVQRLIAQIARAWAFVANAFRPAPDGVALTPLAVAKLVEDAVASGATIPFNAAAWRRAVFDDFAPGAPGRLNIPQREAPGSDPLMAVTEEEMAEAEYEGVLRGTADDDLGPLFNRKLTGGQLTPQDIAALKKNYADVLLKAGVALRFVTPGNITVRDRKVMGDRGVGYRSMTKSSAPPEIVIDATKFTSPAAAARAIDEQLVAQHGLRGLLGAQVYGEFRKAIYDPANSELGRISASAIRALNKLRASVTQELQASGLTPSPRDITDVMLGRMAEAAETAKTSTAMDTTVEILERAMIRGSKPSLDKMHLLTMLARAKNPVNYRAAGGRSTLSKDIISTAFVSARDRDKRSVPSRIMQDESLRQRIWRMTSDYTQPFLRLQNHGRLVGGVIGDRIAERAGALITRLKSYHSQIHRVITAQYGVHDNEAFARTFGEFAGAIGAKTEVEARAVLNLTMAMRASIELNINHALVYGVLEDDALTAQRASIILLADDAVRQIQGNGLRRTADSFLQVQDVRRKMIGDLKALLLAPGATNRVAQYVDASRARSRPFEQEAWADMSGVTIGDAMDVMSDLEALYGNSVVRSFRDTGLDARLRRLMDQTYENRVMSGIYGTQGELLISRLGLEHYSPLRGLEVAQGRFERINDSGEIETDIAAYITARRAPGSRLGADFDPRLGRRTAAVTDVLSTANQEYRTSINEMTTNYINGTLVDLAEAMRAAGIGPEGDNLPPERYPISMDVVPAYMWVDKNGRQLEADKVTDAMIASGEVRSVRDERVTRAYRTMFESGDTGSLLHALPNGDYVVMAVNDPSIYKAMTARFNRGYASEAGSAIMRVFGEFTRVTARAFTSWNPLYTTLRATFRDVQENAAMVYFEQGVSAREAAMILPRAVKLAWHLEWFFQADDAGRQEKLVVALGNPSHPLHNFARRWAAGGVQRFEEQLELRTDETTLRRLLPDLDIGDPPTPIERVLGGIPSGPVDALQTIEQSSLFRRLEAHADATENAVRQVTADALERKFIADGVPPNEASARAYELANSIMDFGQRSDVGEWMAPLFPFAQSALTGLHAAMERRLWKGGKLPTNVFSSEIVDGHLVQSINWGVAVRSANWKMLGTLMTAGFLNVIITSGMLGAGWSFLLGSDGDDEADEKTKAVMAQIWDKSIVKNAQHEARSWLSAQVDAPIKDLFGPDAELADLSELRPFSVFSGWLAPWQTESEQGAAPISYGIIASAVNAGQAMALLALGHDADRVTSAYVNAQIRNFTPLDAPYGDGAVNMGTAAAMVIPPTLKTLYGAASGKELGGDRQLTMGYEGFGTATPEGASNVPTYGQSTRLNEWLLDREIGLEQLGDEGIPLISYMSRTAAGLVPDGRYVENMAMELGLPGQAFVELLRGLENEQMSDAANGRSPAMDAADAAEVVTDFIIKGAGFAKTDPRMDPVSDYYYEAQKSEWKKVQTWDSQTKKHGITYDPQDVSRIGEISGAYRRIIGAMRKSEGEAKKDQLDMYRSLGAAQTQAERDMLWTRINDLEAQSRARYRAAADALRAMREQLDMSVPDLSP